MFQRGLGWSTFIAGSILVLASLLLTACFPAKQTRPPAAQAPAPAAPAPQQVAPAPGPGVAPAVGQPKKGGAFRLLWSDPPTLDPHLTADTSSGQIVVEVFSGLVTISTDLKLEPDIAERWEVSPDGRTYTFFLRRGVKFHDGKPVTAKDFKYSLERAADPKTKSPVADTYLGDIVGVKEKLKGRAAEVSGVKVIDDHTLQITIDTPKAYFLAKLTYPTGFVVDQGNVERLGKAWTQQPNGTGPFKLASYKVGESIILERNPNHYRGAPHLDRVEFILRGGSAMAMYENNEIDMTGVGLADVDRVKNPKDPLNKDLRVAPPGFSVFYFGFNVGVPPFDDVKVRQALNHAINKEAIAENVLFNLVTPAYSILPPGFPGYTGRVAGLRFDPEKAKRLLSESKYAGRLPRIVLTVPGTGGALSPGLEAVLEQWKRVLGITVEIQQVEWATFLQELNQRKLAFFRLGWIADYPDPENFLDVLFHSQSAQNHTGYANPELDRLLEQARVERDWNRRVELYTQAEQIIVNDAPWVPLWFEGQGLVLVKPHVKGFKLLPLIAPHLKEVWLER